jgi:uncharacterized SAM-binding protein YcdF (DUF218 family)
MAALETIGNVLRHQDEAVASDMIVVIRGDEFEFRRTITAAELLRHGLAKRIYVSSALNDASGEALREQGVYLLTPQERIASILVKLGAPCEAIVLDRGPGGGGTVGEMHRIRNAMSRLEVRSVLLVTSWYHSGRVARLARNALGRANLESRVIVAQDTAGPGNWWHQRYVSITVLEEIVKTVLGFLPATVSFADEPRLGTGFTDQYQTSCVVLKHDKSSSL